MFLKLYETKEEEIEAINKSFYSDGRGNISTIFVSHRIYETDLAFKAFLCPEKIHELQERYKLEDKTNPAHIHQREDNIQYISDESDKIYIQITFNEEYPVMFEELLVEFGDLDCLDKFKRDFPKLFNK